MKTILIPILAVLGLIVIPLCRAEESSSKLSLKTIAGKQIDIYTKCSAPGNRYLQIRLQRMTNSDKKMDLWRLTRAFDVEKQGEFQFSDRLGEEIIRPGEWECAIMLSQDGQKMADLMGGFHGYELFTGVEARLDGKDIDLAQNEKLNGSEFYFEQRSTMYLYGTDRPMANHLKQYRITEKGIELHQEVEWLEDAQVENAYLTMLPIVRTQKSGKQITDRLTMGDNPKVYDVSQTNASQRIKENGVKKVKIWGEESGVTAEVTVRYEPELSGNSFFCSMYAPQYNKLYFDFSRQHAVKKGDIWKTDTVFKLDIIK